MMRTKTNILSTLVINSRIGCEPVKAENKISVSKFYLYLSGKITWKPISDDDNKCPWDRYVIHLNKEFTGLSEDVSMIYEG